MPFSELLVAQPLTTPAIALWNQRLQVLNAGDRLRALCDAVDYQNDLALYQWAQWFALALEFKPDLIVELGRGRGNSTCLFTEAANQLGNCRVVSLCLSPEWDEFTQPSVARVVSEDWFRPLDARLGNILTTDMNELLGNSQRVLLLWDAHGYAMADYVLGHALPLLRHRQHMVLMHDISDTRYTPGPKDYQGKTLWRGNNDGYTRLVLGHLNSAVEQVVAIVDFTSRNDLELHSADHSLHQELSPEQIIQLQQQLGEFFSQNGHWFYFSLNEKAETEPIYFPAFSTEPATPEWIYRKDFEQIQQQLQQAKTDLEQAQATIAAIQTSKFWKLRTLWFEIKKQIGLR
ncbi:class I SAM-dependent methyltransferase [Kovacikia minuta CCNUW1]|uniref:class I SAM-dependent methyltransferase n=1 Tax=Kovacikia minuta TaxID=2931930 RepID=UPI001CCE409C|nr:class I SAM-dependent methyltransferase [Kovacikia minuta]UBF24116.1 class I SAM-dependent methyltransferase [Kovacikia minuta CCNUW1]